MKEKAIIIGASIFDLDYHENTARTNELRSFLLDNGYSFDGLQLQSIAGKSNKFLVLSDELDKFSMLARDFSQSDIIYLDEFRNAFRIDVKTNEKFLLGKLEKVSESEAKKELVSLVVFDENNKSHYFITKKD